MSKGRICVIGVGNEQRGDDAIGLHAARLIARRQIAGMDVFEAGDDTTTLMDFWAEVDTAYVIDAIRCGHDRGCVHRFDLHDGPLPATRFSASTHTIGLGQAFELARSLNALPPRLVLYAVEGERFDAGIALSTRAKAGADEAVARLLAEIDSSKRETEVPHA